VSETPTPATPHPQDPNLKSQISNLKSASVALLAFDFDGTLVDHHGDPRFHPHFLNYLRHLKADGARWAINTGRTLHQTLEALGHFGLFELPDFIIARESEIYQPGRFGRWHDLGRWNRQLHRAEARLVRTHRRLFTLLQRQLDAMPDVEFLTRSSGEAGLVTGSIDRMEEICQLLHEHQQQYPDLTYHRNGVHLRFAPRGFSKGTALAHLASHLGLSPASTLAAGDNYNDLSMLDPTVASMITCPSNSLPDVKAHVAAHGGFLASLPASLGLMQALDHFFDSPLGQPPMAHARPAQS
jgi:HAD superfamily hydrolase (TIGR01484 family)